MQAAAGAGATAAAAGSAAGAAAGTAAGSCGNGREATEAARSRRELARRDIVFWCGEFELWGGYMESG